MIFIAFKPLDYRKQVTFPPLILRITQQLMTATVYQIKKLVHEHFRQYLSPFINEHNLNLSIKNAQSMVNDLPLYMYLNQRQFTQYILCTTKPNLVKEQQQKWRFVKNSLVYVVENDQEHILSIPQKEVAMFDGKLENVLLMSSKQKDVQIIVNGKSMIIKERQHNNSNDNNDDNVTKSKWSQIIDKNWKSLARESNDCVYVKIKTR